ncbi:L-threonylcarbamoyladenylate synthase [Cerasibacillus quisquiliarum]|uniref:Threonylcarbamoyl-AMP synthase n=1 Tax=Cerasibacillus quisquiliarum TaxID=227865 RepID=A0A511UZR0_9BACI|nr:L-threonylcarbamoyladenylate synthase [Cerasibacillus quisquiliarum]GEN32079.1 threonylcarbamoyl-AMP synthase [Cerasibacillus quisquiliarum]
MMETIYWHVTEGHHKQTEAIKQAAQLLQQGHTVAFPTETVYGLGADATNEQAVTKIFKAKGRPQDNPLIAHVATKKQLVDIVDKYEPYVDKLIDTFSPGPITYILPSNGTCAANVTAGLDTVGVRIPNHPVALRLLQQANIPIAAPSANISGKPSPTTAKHVWEDLNGKIAGIVDGGLTGVGVESTVLDCTEHIPVILRPGGISLEELEQVIGPVNIDPALMENQSKPKAPGMKYKHYTPDVPLWLVDGSIDTLNEIVAEAQKDGNRVAALIRTDDVEQIKTDQYYLLGNSLQEIAQHLYDALRTFKKEDTDIIICQTVPEKGIGQAIMNRLKKAAHKTISS